MFNLTPLDLLQSTKIITVMKHYNMQSGHFTMVTFLVRFTWFFLHNVIKHVVETFNVELNFLHLILTLILKLKLNF